MDIDFITSSDSKSEDSPIANITNVKDIYYYIDNSIKSKDIFKKINIIVEIIEIKIYQSMIFAKIKDDTDIIKAIIYKNNYKTNLQPGDKIKINASLILYRGELELIIKSYTTIGIGNSISKLEKLKKELAKLGYFDTKPVLETNYQKIGIISSLNAAGMKDFLYTLNERCCGKIIYIYPSTMQGLTAPNEIKKAISLANQHNAVDILVLIRGGGSKDDLECFNTEEVAISIFHSKIPIVTGIGHQIDVSLADLVSYKNYITPTAVAQNITLENNITKSSLEKIINTINNKIINRLNDMYTYIKNQQKIISQLYLEIINSFENQYKIHKIFNTKKQCIIVSNINNRYNYIIKEKNDLFHLMTTYHQTLNTIHIHHQLKLSNYMDCYGQILSSYHKNIKNIVRPKIMVDGIEISSLADMNKHNTFSIQFIDGEYQFKK